MRVLPHVSSRSCQAAATGEDPSLEDGAQGAEAEVAESKTRPTEDVQSTLGWLAATKARTNH